MIYERTIPKGEGLGDLQVREPQADLRQQTNETMKYKYRDKIEKKLVGFDKYLRSKKYAIDTIRQTRNYAGVYLKWLEEHELIAEEMEYKGFMNFIFQLKKNRSINLVNRILLAIRHYYKSLDIDKNPASGIHIRGTRKSILNNIVPYSQLIKLYGSYECLDD